MLLCYCEHFVFCHSDMSRTRQDSGTEAKSKQIVLIGFNPLTYIKIHPLPLRNLWRGKLRHHRSGKKKTHKMREFWEHNWTWHFGMRKKELLQPHIIKLGEHTWVWGAPPLLMTDRKMRGKRIIWVNKIFSLKCVKGWFKIFYIC